MHLLGGAGSSKIGGLFSTIRGAYPDATGRPDAEGADGADSRTGPAMTAALDGADPQQVIAELRRQLDEALAQRSSEYSERIAHQAAANDVLKAMAASPGDPRPVFDLFVCRARELCNAYAATLYGFDGNLIDSCLRRRSLRQKWRPPTGVSSPWRQPAEVRSAERFSTGKSAISAMSMPIRNSRKLCETSA